MSKKRNARLLRKKTDRAKRRYQPRQKSTLTLADIPDGIRGTFELTPEISKATHTHVKDVQKLITQKTQQYGDLMMSITVIPTGLRFRWCPESDLENLEDVTPEDLPIAPK